MRGSLVVVLLGVAALGAACSGGSGTGSAASGPPAGTERGPCYGNGTCDDGLACASDICVRVEGTSSSRGSLSSMGGSSNGGMTSSSAAASSSAGLSSSAAPASSATAVSSTSHPDPSSAPSSGTAGSSSAASASSTGCVPETDQAYCARLQKDCGTVVGFDNCGASRSTVCGACNAPQECGALQPNVCACAPETDAQFCSRGGFTCGEASALDNCGVPRTVTCGPACPCVPDTDEQVCLSHNLTCMAVSAQDNCGGWRSLLCRNGCAAGVCQVLGTGSDCSGGPQAGDSLNNCLNGLCVPARMWCAYNPSTSTWSFQAPGVGGGGADTCSCTSPTHIAARFNTLPAANTDQDCTQCVELPGSRVVCF